MAKVTAQLTLDLRPRRRETDMSVWFRARSAGWAPQRKHCPPATGLVADGWREDAERYLRATS